MKKLSLRVSQKSSITDRRTENPDIDQHSIVVSTEQLVQKAQKPNSLVNKLFPDKTTRLVKEGEGELVSLDFQFRKKELETLRETKLQALQELCNQYLKQGKAESRSQITEFMLLKHKELLNRTNCIFDEFMSDLQSRFEGLERFSPELQEVYREKLEEDFERFKQVQDGLLDEFADIISEGV